VAVGALFPISAWNQPTGCTTGILKGADMTWIDVDTDILPGQPSRLEILYYGGPAFFPWQYSPQAASLKVLARYSLPGSQWDTAPAMIEFTFGSGRVFLAGPHPEISMDGCDLTWDSSNWAFMGVILQRLLE
jgi:glutamine amidotransferase-like uncharacterized protein